MFEDTGWTHHVAMSTIAWASCGLLLATGMFTLDRPHGLDEIAPNALLIWWALVPLVTSSLTIAASLWDPYELRLVLGVAHGASVLAGLGVGAVQAIYLVSCLFWQSEVCVRWAVLDMGLLCWTAGLLAGSVWMGLARSLERRRPVRDILPLEIPTTEPRGEATWYTKTH